MNSPSAVSALQEWERWAGHILALRAAIEWRHGGAASPGVRRHATLVFLDTVGCALAGRTAGRVAAVERQLAARDSGPFRFPRGEGLGLRAACQLMATASTWHEACEGHAFAHGRPGVPVIAALLPLAWQCDATFGDLIDALAVGYEVGARAGAWLRVAPGLHVDGNWPALGVAAGVARLLGLTVDESMRAIAIAGCQLPASLYLPIRTGRDVRNLYLAHSATLGLDAALAAQAGVDAPPDALAYYADHLCRAAPAPLPPAQADLILDAYLKPFAAVRHVHYGALAARRIRNRLNGETAGVTRIELAVYEEATVYCGNPRPATPLAAQFSLTFGVAAMLRFGELDAASYEPPRFGDPELRRLEALVEVRVDPGLTAQARRGAALRLTSDAREYEEQVGPGADPQLLVEARGAVDKFVRNAGPLPTEAAGREFCAALLEAGPATPVRELWQLLHPTHDHHDGA